MKRVDHPNFGTMYDTFHANIEEKDPIGAIDTVNASGKLFHVHISENDRSTPGEGHVDWATTFRTLKEVKYDGWLVVEAEQDPKKAHPLTYATLGYRNLARMAGEAGFTVET